MASELGVMFAFVLAALAVVIELPSRMIPNWLTLPGVLVGLGLGVYEQDLATHGLGLLVLTLVAISLFATKWVGGGGGKLLMAVGALAGPGPGLAAGLALWLFLLIAWTWWKLFVSEPDEELGAAAHGRLALPSSPLVLIGLVGWWMGEFLKAGG